MIDPDVRAVVLTHRRPRLAGELVRSLVELEGFEPDQVILVIDRDGGLDDRALQERLTVLRLQENQGPAGGFLAGLEAAFADPATQFAYLCEDDVLLEGVRAPRVAALREEVARLAARGRKVGAVVAYGRVFRARRGGTTLPHRPDPEGDRLQPVDVAAWGATLVTRRAWESGARPDPQLFFGYEDFDYFLRIRAAGLEILVDRDSGTDGTMVPCGAGMGVARRPAFDEEPWRAFYVARNFFELARRHGRRTWQLWHLLLCVRRFQLAHESATRQAIVAGTLAGLRGRLGRDPRYARLVGEWPFGRPG